MGVRSKVLLGLVSAIVGMGLASSVMAAPRVSPEERPLNQPSIPEALDAVGDLNEFWVRRDPIENGIGSDAMFLFGITRYRDQDISQSAQQLQDFYEDVLAQQSSDALVRTRDLASPFCTSILGLVPPCNMAVQAPPAPAPVFQPAPPVPFIPEPPVRALY